MVHVFTMLTMLFLLTLVAKLGIGAIKFVLNVLLSGFSMMENVSLFLIYVKLMI